MFSFFALWSFRTECIIEIHAILTLRLVYISMKFIQPNKLVLISSQCGFCLFLKKSFGKFRHDLTDGLGFWIHLLRYLRGSELHVIVFTVQQSELLMAAFETSWFIQIPLGPVSF